MNKVCLMKARYKWAQEWDAYSEEWAVLNKVAAKKRADERVKEANAIARGGKPHKSYWTTAYSSDYMVEWSMRLQAKRPRPIDVCAK
jgi:hypothetical protein